MSQNVIDKVRRVMAESQLLRTIAAVRSDGGILFALGQVPLRALFDSEVEQLERLGNRADNWAHVRVAEGFNPRRVRGCRFHGDVVLGRFDQPVFLTGALAVPSGLSNCTLAHCVIGHNSLLQDVRLLANYAVAEGVRLVDCGQVVGEGETAFGNGMEVTLGPETGGREVAVFAEIEVETAAAVALGRADRDFLGEYSEIVAEYQSRARCGRGIIEHDAVVQSTPRVRNAYLGPCARVEGATLLDESTVLSDSESPTRVETGACVRSSLLQWGSRVETLAVVERSVLTEQSHVERHGKVVHSLLGPNTVVGAGEVTSCLLGPFVSSHHQSLLIATLWPSGKGNVGYGANVGSNHTSRVPDQEFWAGEGMFFGLGVNVKFPTDFRRSPYTVVACGVTLGPQRVAFPFSLIVGASACQGPQAVKNEIIPAWMLAENLYALKRCESKFRSRSRARRAAVPSSVIRHETVEMMLDACLRLEASRLPREVYTSRDIEGLGKNVLREAARQEAVATYRFFIRLYALRGLKDRLEAALRSGDDVAPDRILSCASADEVWEHQRQLLRADAGVADVLAGLSLLTRMLEQEARQVEEARAKDDACGRKVLADYAQVHPPAAIDRVVQETWAEARRLQDEIEALFNTLAQKPSWTAQQSTAEPVRGPYMADSFQGISAHLPQTASVEKGD